MNEKRNVWLPVALMLAFALTRWPGLLPPNFSAAYALAFCAGVFLPRWLAWWLPLATLGATDLLLNLHYASQGIDAWHAMQFINYGAFALLIWLGTRFQPRAAWWWLVLGGLAGAVVFYLVTNTAAWFFNPFQNPEYTKTLAGWIIALTKGTAGYPETWQFFRNTLLSGGLFTALFAGAVRLVEKFEESPEPEPEQAPAREEDAAEPHRAET
ncbi:MAG TPA: DUF6580 family putative transport protein [Methylomirabilota bacterium]|nr:DUF6580 family putative transport protein [Methylomirabilota bacterium]